MAQRATRNSKTPTTFFPGSSADQTTAFLSLNLKVSLRRDVETRVRLVAIQSTQGSHNFVVFLVDTEYNAINASRSKNSRSPNSSKTTARLYNEAT